MVSASPLVDVSPAPHIDLPIEGMSCAGCAARIEKALGRAEGVTTASVNFATNSARVVFDSGRTNPERLAAVVNDLGYHAVPPAPAAVHSQGGNASAHDHAGHDHAGGDLGRRLIVSAVCTLPILVIAMSHGTIPVLNHPVFVWVQLLLTIPVLVYGGWPIFRAAALALKHGTAEMNVLVAMGTTVAFLQSVSVTLRANLSSGHGSHESMLHAPHVYFEAAATIITLVLLGRWLEARARQRTGDAVRQLLQLAPPTAIVERGGNPIEIPLEKVHVGDLVVIRSGSRIPVDGTIESGRSEVDESMLTGESLPVLKEPGGKAYAGTMNTTGQLRLRAEQVGAETALQQIAQQVQDAQAIKAPISRLADRVAGIFTPTVIGLAALTFVLWMIFGPTNNRVEFALTAMVSVLIIACPCALGLATPTAVLVGTGRAAQLGILFRSGEALEETSRLNTLAFDKTGTLTVGRPEVKAFQCASDTDEAEAIRLTVSLERAASHPLGEAILKWADARGVKDVPVATNVETLPGTGIRGTINGRMIEVGKASETDNAFPLDDWRNRGWTVVVTRRDGQLVAAYAMADAVREESSAVIKALKKRGFQTVMLTGDHAAAANEIARIVGIDSPRSSLSPDQKTAAINDLRAQGRIVGMVGDGINDAPALTAADIGVAMGSGTEIAVSSADLTLLGGKLTRVVDAVDLSRAAMSIIRQNLGWAFGYNVIAIPLAAGLFYPWTGWMLTPMVASAAMACSSVSVVFNSLRLRWAVPQPFGESHQHD